jgi:uncharacterized coiled-coil protein SlyX
MNTLAATLADQGQRLHQLAHHLTENGHERIGQSALYHAAALALAAQTARGLEARLAVAEAQLAGARAALAQSRATVHHLTAELQEEDTLRQADPAHQARQRVIDNLKASLPRTTQ